MTESELNSCQERVRFKSLDTSIRSSEFKFKISLLLVMGSWGITKSPSVCFLNYFPGGSDSKASVYNVGDLGLIPGLGRFPGEGNGNPLQYSCLENPMGGGAWCRLLSMGPKELGTTEQLHFHFSLII